MPDQEPPCPPPSPETESGSAPVPLIAVRRSFGEIPRAAWDALFASSAWATPFSGWPFHRAWWDAYGANAHDETLVVVRRDQPDRLVGIVPLMHRHEVEPDDAILRTQMRHGTPGHPTPVAPTAKAVFFGAAYHADYATFLAAAEDLAAVAEATVRELARPASSGDPHPDPWDVVDLRRLRCGDRTADALADAFRARAAREGWAVTLEQEDVCPVVTVPEGLDFEGYLGTLDKKERHEIRRKVRRAEAAGRIALEPSTDPVGDMEAFVELHQKRWGAEGLFPATEGGAQSRRFMERLFELAGGDGTVELRFLTMNGRRIAAGVAFVDEGSVYYYNAGVDPAARELSAGVVMVARWVADAIARGRRRVDFLRGDEAYKYEWGAVNEPIRRLLVVRG